MNSPSYQPNDAATRAATRRHPARLLGWALLAAAAIYLVLLAAIWLEQERLLFQPSVLDAATTLATEPDVVERRVDVPGASLSMLELRLPDPRGVVFYLHGNGGNLQSWFVNTGLYRRANFDLVMFDYRGYGKSSGQISDEAQLHADVQAVWQQVAPRYAGRKVVLFGRSLGTGLAAALAATIQPTLTVLVSPYTSMLALARLHYPWVPPLLLRYPLSTDLAIAGIRTPVLLVHGERDNLIPLAHSQALQRLAPQSRLVVISDAAHNDLQNFDSYRQLVQAALDGT